MNIPPKYEDLVFQLNDLNKREAKLREELSVLEHWRDLALQFDNHRMKALWHLKTLVSDGAHYDAARNFLSEPPIQASALQQRLTVAEQRVDLLEGLLKSGSSPTYAHCSAVMEALKPDEEGEGS